LTSFLTNGITAGIGLTLARFAGDGADEEGADELEVDDEGPGSPASRSEASDPDFAIAQKVESSLL
jgi:hypothetical protein